MIAFKHAFHGRTSAAVRVTGDSSRTSQMVTTESGSQHTVNGFEHRADQQSAHRETVADAFSHCDQVRFDTGILVGEEFTATSVTGLDFVQNQASLIFCTQGTGTTFGGNHLACAAAIAVLEIMENEKLIDNAAQVGNFLIEELHKLPGIKEIRGRGLMIGIEFEESIKEVRSKLLFEEKVFTGVAGTNTIRLLPPLCLTMDEAKEFLTRFKKVLNA